MRIHTSIIVPIVAALLGTGCELADPAKGIATHDVITLTPERRTVTANGSDMLFITATLGPLADANKEVTFRTDWGTFAGVPQTEENADRTLKQTTSGKVVTARLVADSTHKRVATITATVNGFTDTTTIEIGRSYPDSVWLTLDRGSIVADLTEKANATIVVERITGKVTEGTPVYFSAAPDASSGAAVEITPAAYIHAGTATATVRSLTKTAGTVTVHARVRLADGSERTLTQQLVLTN